MAPGGGGVVARDNGVFFSSSDKLLYRLWLYIHYVCF